MEIPLTKEWFIKVFLKFLPFLKGKQELPLSEPTKEMIGLADKYAELSGELDIVEAQEKKIKAGMDEIERSLVEIMQDFDVQRFAYQDHTFYLQPCVFPKIKDWESFRAWLEENGFTDLVKETVHPSTLRGFINERVESGVLEYPPGIDIHAETQIRMRKKK